MEGWCYGFGLLVNGLILSLYGLSCYPNSETATQAFCCCLGKRLRGFYRQMILFFRQIAELWIVHLFGWMPG
jgi:hypothetical protein